MFDANTLSTEARKVCRANKMTARKWEPIAGMNTASDQDLIDGTYPVLRVINTRRELIIEAWELWYASEYL